MMNTRSTARRLHCGSYVRPRSSRCFSLVEVTISIVVVGLMMVAAVTAVGSTSLGRRINADRLVGRLLAEQLMAEILDKGYDDPDDPGSFGLDGNEAATGDRSLFDDVDDYDGWSASPPQMDDGTVIPERDGWTRSVDVDYVSLSDFTTIVGTSQGIKRIIVTVTRNGAEVASLVAIRGITGGSVWGY